MWSLSDLKLDSPALCIVVWEYLLICIFCFLFRPVENPADDVLCIEVWYVLPSVQFIHLVGSIFAKYKASACSYYQLQLLIPHWFYLLWSTIKLKVFMVDMQHLKISSACECLGFYSDANKVLFSVMWYCITRHMFPDISTQLTGLIFKGRKGPKKWDHYVISKCQKPNTYWQCHIPEEPIPLFQSPYYVISGILIQQRQFERKWWSLEKWKEWRVSESWWRRLLLLHPQANMTMNWLAVPPCLWRLGLHYYLLGEILQ